MLLSSIDVRFKYNQAAYRQRGEGKVIRRKTEMVITRLASGIAETGMLNADNMEKSVSVLKAFSDIISAYGISRIKSRRYKRIKRGEKF